MSGWLKETGVRVSYDLLLKGEEVRRLIGNLGDGQVCVVTEDPTDPRFRRVQLIPLNQSEQP